MPEQGLPLSNATYALLEYPHESNACACVRVMWLKVALCLREELRLRLELRKSEGTVTATHWRYLSGPALGGRDSDV